MDSIGKRRISTDSAISTDSSEKRPKLEEYEAGYKSNSISEPIANSIDQNSQERGTDPFHLPGTILGGLTRGRTRSIEPSPILGIRFLAEIPQNLKSGQTRLVREFVRINENVFNVPAEMEAVCDKLRRRRTVFAIAQQKEPVLHYHIVHACPWKWYCCRCYTTQVSRRSIRTAELHSTTQSDWNSVFQYLSSGGRLLQYLSSGSSLIKRFCGIKYIPDPGLCNNRSEELLASGNYENEGMFNTNENESDQQCAGYSGEPYKKQSTPARKARLEDIEAMLMQHATVPLHSICSTNVWQSSTFRFIDSNDTSLKKVISSIQRRICRWSYKEFEIYYANNKGIVWEALYNNFDDYYYSVSESEKVICKLLEYQFFQYAAAQSVTVYEMTKLFLQDVFNICEKRKPKVNCLEIIGPTSSGKSYFVDMVCAFYLNVGHVKNSNKNKNFPLQSCINRRILLWNEAQCKTSQHDTIKLLLGGDPCPANVRYMDSQTIARTPVFITANNQLIPTTRPFQDRMIRYTWERADFLQTYQKKPHPLTFISLLQNYDVILD